MGKSFWIMTHGYTSSEDNKVLTLLYQPLIGTEAYGLYMMLMNLVDRTRLQSDVMSLSVLSDLLNIKEELLLNSKDKLEAIGLLSTFLKEDIYLFRLNMPLSAKQFFLDGILGSYLRSEVGIDNFDLLMAYFSVPEISKKGYKNVTKTFDDIYQIQNIDIIQSEKFIFGRKNGKGVIVKDAFNFDSLFEKLPPRIKKKSLYPQKIVSQIASVMYVYNFRLDEMADILSSAYDEENKALFYERIGINSANYFQKTYGDNLISVEEKDHNCELNLSAIRPQDIVGLFGQKMTNQAFALETIRQFIDRNAVDIGLINAVIIVALKYHDELPGLNYLEKVLNDWLSKGIKTGDEALPIIEKTNETVKPTKRKKPKKGVEWEEPAWLDEILDSLGEKS
ncbi:MAG: DnaD domain protein [Acholeplasmataceae bacterium]|jgi:replication initiation and membrane attachment protein|nr:DnaD domain protein [Acholeplasmataceae bacterium]